MNLGEHQWEGMNETLEGKRTAEMNKKETKLVRGSKISIHIAFMFAL